MTEKAVETMLEKASELPVFSVTTRPETYFKSGFRLGYHQAEKDLELTWEDIDWIVGEAICNTPDNLGKEQICKEVLKRFKNLKK